METVGNNAPLAPGSYPNSPKSYRKHRATKPQLLTRDKLDGRSNAARLFDRLVADIQADLGGADRLSRIELALVEAFAGASVTLHHLNSKLLLGEQIDFASHAHAVSAMVRVATRLGMERRPRDVGPPVLREYLTASEGEAPP